MRVPRISIEEAKDLVLVGCAVGDGVKTACLVSLQSLLDGRGLIDDHPSAVLRFVGIGINDTDWWDTDLSRTETLFPIAVDERLCGRGLDVTLARENERLAYLFEAARRFLQDVLLLWRDSKKPVTAEREGFPEYLPATAGLWHRLLGEARLASDFERLEDQIITGVGQSSLSKGFGCLASGAALLREARFHYTKASNGNPATRTVNIDLCVTRCMQVFEKTRPLFEHPNQGRTAAIQTFLEMGEIGRTKESGS